MLVAVGSFAGSSPEVGCFHPLSGSSLESLTSSKRVNERGLGSSLGSLSG